MSSDEAPATYATALSAMMTLTEQGFSKEELSNEHKTILRSATDAERDFFLYTMPANDPIDTSRVETQAIPVPLFANIVDSVRAVELTCLLGEETYHGLSEESVRRHVCSLMARVQLSLGVAVADTVMGSFTAAPSVERATFADYLRTMNLPQSILALFMDPGVIAAAAGEIGHDLILIDMVVTTAMEHSGRGDSLKNRNSAIKGDANGQNVIALLEHVRSLATMSKRHIALTRGAHAATLKHVRDRHGRAREPVTVHHAHRGHLILKHLPTELAGVMSIAESQSKALASHLTALSGSVISASQVALEALSKANVGYLSTVSYVFSGKNANVAGGEVAAFNITLSEMRRGLLARSDYESHLVIHQARMLLGLLDTRKTLRGLNTDDTLARLTTIPFAQTDPASKEAKQSLVNQIHSAAQAGNAPPVRTTHSAPTAVPHSNAPAVTGNIGNQGPAAGNAPAPAANGDQNAPAPAVNGGQAAPAVPAAPTMADRMRALGSFTL